MSATGVVLAGRYRLEARIAAGGVGEVWRGTDEVLGRPVAVKLLRAEPARQGETLARFRSEARHAGSLSHPGIAQVYDYGEAEQPYLVMERADGPSLTSPPIRRRNHRKGDDTPIPFEQDRGNRLDRDGSRQRPRVTISQVGVSYDREGSSPRRNPRACRRSVGQGMTDSARSHGG